jgi:hypothetical protein
MPGAASGHGSSVRLYARSPALRGRQLLADVGLLAWLVVWVLVARTVHAAVLALAGPEGLSVAPGRPPRTRSARSPR